MQREIEHRELLNFALSDHFINAQNNLELSTRIYKCPENDFVYILMLIWIKWLHLLTTQSQSFGILSHS